MTARRKRNIILIITIVLFLILIAFEIVRYSFFSQLEHGELLYIIATRFLSGFVCLLFICTYSSPSMLRFTVSAKSMAVFLPCMLVAVNNFPFITFLSGEAYIDGKPIAIMLYALSCLGVGFFEEMAFRGCIFTAILQRCKRKPSGIFWAIVLSSLVFGAVHLVNVFAGASLPSVILQMGYSFLIGGMCSIVLIKTANIWYCVILHSVYNFSGGVVPECGGGTIWNTPTVVLTAVVAVAVASYVIYLLLRIKPQDVSTLLNERAEDEQTNTEA